MRRVVAAGVVGGFGLAMVFQSEVIQQMLQWHHTLSGVLPRHTLAGIRMNHLADAALDIAAWLVLTAAVALLITARPLPSEVWSSWNFSGWLLSGGSGWVILDGVVNQLLLGIHHAREDALNVLACDLGYLVFLGIFPLLVSLLLWAARSAPRPVRLASPVALRSRH